MLADSSVSVSLCIERVEDIRDQDTGNNTSEKQESEECCVFPRISAFMLNSRRLLPVSPLWLTVTELRAIESLRAAVKRAFLGGGDASSPSLLQV
jgi:hypothetical protein